MNKKINDLLLAKQDPENKLYHVLLFLQEESSDMVYEDLLYMGFSSHNVEKVIRVVLKQFAGVEVDRPPKATFVKYMLIEARGLAKIDVASKLAGMSDCNTLHSDGISKHGYTLMSIRVMISF